jgi:ribokinase
VTLGAKGALLCNAAGTYFQPAETVEVVDTTAAGDTFNGVLAAMIAKGQPLQSAVKTAVHAATMSVQSAGAIASIPHLDP